MKVATKTDHGLAFLQHARLGIVLATVCTWHIAFYAPLSWGFCMVFAMLGLWLVMLADAAYVQKKTMIRAAARDGLLIGAGWYALHFIWLFILLVDKSMASLLCTTLLYCSVVLGFVIPYIAWFMVTTYLCWLGSTLKHYAWSSAGILLISLSFYSWYLERISIWFMGVGEGYPLVVPSIPLAHYRLFQHIVFFWASIWGIGVNHTHNDIDPSQNALLIRYVPPYTQAASTYHADTCVHHVFNALNEDNAYAPSNSDRVDEHALKLIFSPESTVPCAINTYPALLNSLSKVVPHDAYYLFGAFRRDKSGDCYQSIYCLHNYALVDVYDKTHCVPFNEWVPDCWKTCGWAQQLFLGDAQAITPGTNRHFEGCFRIHDRLCCIPVVCSEMFFCDAVARRVMQHRHSNPVLVCWFVNDSWFTPYLRRLLVQLGRLRALQLGTRVVYIGHQKLTMF